MAIARRATLAGRWPVILDEDLPAVDELTGSRHASFVVLRELIEAGQMERVRRGAYVMRDEKRVKRRPTRPDRRADAVALPDHGWPGARRSRPQRPAFPQGRGPGCEASSWIRMAS